MLLIIDGRKAHIDTRIPKLATDHRVEVLRLPLHSTTDLQPSNNVTLTKMKTALGKLITLNTQTNCQKPCETTLDDAQLPAQLVKTRRRL